LLGLWLVVLAGVTVGCAAARPVADPITPAELAADQRASDDDELVVAAVSCESKVRDTEHNLSRIEHWARAAAAAGAELVLFPEAGISAWWQSREVRTLAEPINGPSIKRLIKLAGELGVVLAVGMTEKDGRNAYITHVLLDGEGVIGRHRKSSLAGGANGEGRTWEAGNDANVFDIAGVKIGVAICFESVHPETCRKLKANGAEIILAPYANGTQPEELLNDKRPYTYARARENGVWYVACDATPHNQDRSLRRGAAYVISPEGQLVALTAPDATDENMVVYAIPLHAEPRP
jgi:predicted amidohydrolase